jgi:ATPase subunit of ABC transporter with duplicated ATPase domains
VKNTAWYKALPSGASLRLLAAEALIRVGRIEEGKGTLLELVKPTVEIKNASGYSEELRWAAGKALSQFPEHRQLVEQVWEEIARTEKYMKAYNIKVRKVAITKLKENKQVRALLDIGSNRSTYAELRKDIAAALGELGHTREAEAIARDIGPRRDDDP